MKDKVCKFRTIPVSFSDHHAVLCDINLANVNKYHFSYLKIDFSVAEDNDVYMLFKNYWQIYKNKINV